MSETNLNQILTGDCLELFRGIRDNTIDMTFADPPFNLKKGYNSYSDNLVLKEYLGWCEKWVELLNLQVVFFSIIYPGGLLIIVVF